MKKRRTSPFLLVITCLFALLLSACASTPPATPQIEDLSKVDTEKLFVVDCLLPPQVRKLGSGTNFLVARRPIKTSAIDCEIRGGEYIAFDRANYSTALKTWLPMAKAGDEKAQTYVGEIYEKGLGIAPDYELAAHWYQQAAEKGYSRAQINLGYLYEQGLGVEKDLVAAMNWYRQASGLPDDLEFVSSVEIQATSARLASQESEIAELKTALNETKGKLNKSLGLRSTLEKELESLKKKINTLENKPLTQDETNELQKLRSQLKSRTVQLEEQRIVITRLEQETENRSTRLNKAERDYSGPAIEIFDPAISVARGAPRVRLRSANTRQREIFGRISAPSGLLTFNVNEEAQHVSDNGMFRFTVDIEEDETPVNLVAIDQNGKRAVVEFIIMLPSATESAAPVTAKARLKSTAGKELGNFHALVIGNNNYRFLPQLRTAVNDAEKVEEVLRKKYGFETIRLLNADRHSIMSALHQLRDKVGEEDNVLIYYAGHGDLDRVNDRGYWLPVDAEIDNPANWISNVAITDMLNTLPARHVLVVADSCYSGAMTRTAVARIDINLKRELQEKWLRLMSKSRSRTVLTSGGLQPVLDEGGGDHSIFARAFIEVLDGNEDLLQGYSLFRKVFQTVSERSSKLGVEQSPEYAPIRHAGHETGQFFLLPGSS